MDGLYRPPHFYRSSARQHQPLEDLTDNQQERRPRNSRRQQSTNSAPDTTPKVLKRQRKQAILGLNQWRVQEVTTAITTSTSKKESNYTATANATQSGYTVNTQTTESIHGQEETTTTTIDSITKIATEVSDSAGENNNTTTSEKDKKSDVALRCPTWDIGDEHGWLTCLNRPDIRWVGQRRTQLGKVWDNAIAWYVRPGSHCEQIFGRIYVVRIEFRRAHGAVHNSAYMPTFEESITLKIEGENMNKTCHVFDDGTGTESPEAERQ